jgi:nucleotide-binding universal stress UspA family protein
VPAPILIAFDPLRADPAPLELGLTAHELTGAPLIVAVVSEARPVVGDVAVARDPKAALAAEQGLGHVSLPVPFEPLLLTDTSPARALHQAAEKAGAGLIVVGSTARSAAGRVLPGSTAERLLSGGTCAVALAPCGWERHPFATVAAGFVDTPEGHAALRAAHLLAERCDAKLRVISVLRPSSGFRDAAAQGAPPAREYDLVGRDRAAHEATLHQAVASLGASVTVEPEVQVGDPAEALVRISAHVDALVCGSRGYGALRGVLLGGVSRQVVNSAQCPVLVLPRGVDHPIGELVTAPATAANSSTA